MQRLIKTHSTERVLISLCTTVKWSISSLISWILFQRYLRYNIPYLCNKYGISAKKEWFYYTNKEYNNSNTPGTKSIKFGLTCSILHFKMDKIIKFESIWNPLEPFLESLQEIHVNEFLPPPAPPSSPFFQMASSSLKSLDLKW